MKIVLLLCLFLLTGCNSTTDNLIKISEKLGCLNAYVHLKRIGIITSEQAKEGLTFCKKGD